MKTFKNFREKLLENIPQDNSAKSGDVDADEKKVKECEQMTPRQKKIKMERLRDRK